MDWQMVLISQQRQRDLLRQAERERMARAMAQSSKQPSLVLNALRRSLLSAAGRLQPRPQPNSNTRHVYTSVKQS